jgi:alanine racemase
MTWTSELIATQHLHAGERVGYGFSYEAHGEITIGVVACGYATVTRGTRRPARRC